MMNNFTIKYMSQLIILKNLLNKNLQIKIKNIQRIKIIKKKMKLNKFKKFKLKKTNQTIFK